MQAIPRYIKKFELIFSKYKVTKKIGIKPFIKSKKRTDDARNLFPVLSAFVAPIFPLPIFLISPYPKNFDNISPKGIEPNMYDVTNKIKYMKIFQSPFIINIINLINQMFIEI